MKIKIDEVKFLKDLYPRTEADNETINQYRGALDKLPPILVTKEDKILVDGYHTFTAHKLEGEEYIEADIIDLKDDKEILVEAIRRNATHGKQLSVEEKRKNARMLYQLGTSEKDLMLLLSVSEKTIERYLSDLKQAENEERDRQIWDLWLNCRTQEEIEKEMNISQPTASRTIKNIQKRHLSEMNKNPIIPEELQYFTVWKLFSLRDNQMKYAGVLPEGIIENVVYYYTEPFDTVVDPMAGSGVLGDVCKRMNRRFLLYDIKPIREDINIEKNDILKGLPSRCNGATLVFLDPPYYNLMADDYVKNEFTESYDSFLKVMEVTLKNCKKVLKQGGFISLKLKPMTVEMLNGDWLDMSFDCVNIAKKLKLKYVRRISCPMPHNIFSATDMANAKNKKTMLNTVSDIIIFQKV